MNRILLFVALAALGTACAPKVNPTFQKQPNRVLLSSADIDQLPGNDSVRLIKTGGVLFAPNLKIKTMDGMVTRVPKKTVWGYTDENGRVWRYYRKGFYEIKNVGDLVEYEVMQQQINTAGPNQTFVRHMPVAVFSKTLDSRIFGNRKKALRDSPSVPN